MNLCWKMLPDEIVLEIMSFGDPNITLLYTNVMCQLLHHVTEFNYYRKNKPNNRWYNVTFDNYYKYVLRKNFIKKHVYKQYNNRYNKMARICVIILKIDLNIYIQ